MCSWTWRGTFTGCSSLASDRRRDVYASAAVLSLMAGRTGNSGSGAAPPEGSAAASSAYSSTAVEVLLLKMTNGLFGNSGRAAM